MSMHYEPSLMVLPKVYMKSLFGNSHAKVKSGANIHSKFGSFETGALPFFYFSWKVPWFADEEA